MAEDMECTNNKYGLTPLQRASQVGRLWVVKILCEQGAYVDARSSHDGRTPLLLALLGRHTSVALYLLKEQGADGSIQDCQGLTPLHYACHFGLLEVVQCLVENKNENKNKNFNIEINATSRLGKNYHRGVLDSWEFPTGTTPLHCVCGSDDNLQIVQCLISHGANLKAQDGNGKTPMQYALESRSLDIAEILINAGGRTIWPETFLHNEKFDRNHWDDYWELCYMVETMFLLVKRCPIIIHAESKGFVEGIIREYPEILSCVTSSKTGNLPLHDACRYGSKVGVIECMIDAFPKALHRRNARGRLPFHEICASNRRELSDVVSKMFQHFPLVLTEHDGLGMLPIQVAIANGAPLEVIYFLLRESPASLEEIIACKLDE